MDFIKSLHLSLPNKNELIKWINILYTDNIYTFTIRCMTHNLNLNLKPKFCIYIVYPTVIMCTLSVYIRFTLIKFQKQIKDKAGQDS